MRNQGGLHTKIKANGHQYQQQQLRLHRKQHGKTCCRKGCRYYCTTERRNQMRRASVCKPPGQRSGNRACRTCQSEGSGYGTLQMECMMQHQRQRGPKSAERHRQQTLRIGCLAQCRLPAPKIFHGS